MAEGLLRHFFHVAAAKRVYTHPRHGIVTLIKPIRPDEAAAYGLSPLILYAISLPGAPVRWLTFSPIERPRALIEVLSEAWSCSAGLGGVPDALRVSRHLFDNAPELPDRLERIGVHAEVAAATDRSFGGVLNHAQQEARFCGHLSDREPIRTLDDLIEGARQDHQVHFELLRDLPSHLRPSQREVLAEHLRREPRTADAIEPPQSLDWTPGPWLFSWQQQVPRTTKPLYFHNDTGHVLLLDFAPSDCEQDPEPDPEEIDEDAEDEVDYDRSQLAKYLLRCWPNPIGEVARTLGVTRLELEAFNGGRLAPPWAAGARLMGLLGILEEGGILRPYTPRTWQAGARPRDTIELIEQITCGGDTEFCVEVLPATGTPDDENRYLLVQAYGAPTHLVVIPRENPAAGLLDTPPKPRHPIGLNAPARIPDDSYALIAHGVLAAARSPERNALITESLVDTLRPLIAQLEKAYNSLG